MKAKKIISAVFAVIGVCAAAAAVFLGLRFRDAAPVLLTPPDEAKGHVVALMDAVCAGDYQQASTHILGTPSLGVDREAADDVGVLIWDAFVDSLSYELEGDCYATDDGLAQNVIFSCMDITSVTANLRDRSQTMLEQRVKAAEDASEIYDEDYQYREEFVMEVLHDSTVEALKEDAREMTLTLTLNLSYRDGQWWVVANNELLDAISGGILY